MRRGDLVTVAAPGDCGKPRPAVVIQSDWLAETDSILVALVTSTLRDAPLHRVALAPAPSNGLRAPSQIMVDKLLAVPRAKCGPAIGRLDDALRASDRALALVVGLADR